MIDQASFDLLASVEVHRQTSAEIDLFYRFLTQEYSQKELVYFLYVRFLAVRELGVHITKLPSH